MLRQLLVASGFIMVTGLTGCAGALVGNPPTGDYQGTHSDRSHERIIADGAITSTIKSHYQADSVLKGVQIQVSTYQKVVTLYGQVASRYMVDRAVRIARNVDGVSRVVSKLSVTP